MSYFEFPHTRTYDSDLGWLIRETKRLQDNLKAADESIEKINEYLAGDLSDLIAAEVDEWVTEHPEYITTVEDGAISRRKLSTDLNHEVDLSQMKDAGILPARPLARLPIPAGYESCQGIAYVGSYLYVSYAKADNSDAIIVRYNDSTFTEVNSLVITRGGHAKFCYNEIDNNFVMFPLWYNGQNPADWVIEIDLSLTTFNQVNTVENIVNGYSHDNHLYLQKDGSQQLLEYTGDFAALEETQLFLPYDSVETTHRQSIYIDENGYFYCVYASPSMVFIGTGESITPDTVKTIYNPYYVLQEAEALTDYNNGQLMLGFEKMDSSACATIWYCNVNHGVVFEEHAKNAFTVNVIHVNSNRPTRKSRGTAANPFHTLEEALYFIENTNTPQGYIWQVSLDAGTYNGVYIRDNIMINANVGDVYIRNVTIRASNLTFNNCGKLKEFSVNAIGSILTLKDMPDDLDADVTINQGMLIASVNSRGVINAGDNTIIKIPSTGSWRYTGNPTVFFEKVFLTGSEDLFDIASPGIYCAQTNAIAGSVSNSPTSNAFTAVIDFSNGNNGRLAMDLTDYTGNRWHSYKNTNSGWSAWVQTIDING